MTELDKAIEEYEATRDSVQKVIDNPPTRLHENMAIAHMKHVQEQLVILKRAKYGNSIALHIQPFSA